MARAPIATPDRVAAITQANDELAALVWLLESVGMRPDGCIALNAISLLAREMGARCIQIDEATAR